MANPTCNDTTLVTNAAGYLSQAISPRTKMALTVYAKVLELAAIGGTDYIATMVTTLAQDASTLFKGYTPDQLKAANIAILFQNATAAGASVPTTIDAKMAVINKLVNEDPVLLDKMDALLNCKLGVHKAYVQ